MKPVALTLAVPGITGFGPAPVISASLFLPRELNPPKLTPDAMQRVAFCLHGGGYGKRYFDIVAPSHEGYSMCRHMAERGVIAVTIDGLGTGESSKAEDARFVTAQTLAAAHHDAANQLFDGLAAGTLIAGVPPLRRLAKIGIGHSLGGMLLSMQQAYHRTFDRLAILGWSNLGLALSPAALTPVLDATGTYATGSPALRQAFHLPDVPASVLNCEAERENFPVSMTLAAQAADRETVAAAVRSIECPVFVSFGEQDTAVRAHDEPGVYAGSDDVTFYRLRGSAHCHNFATTRALLWDRILGWMGSQ